MAGAGLITTRIGGVEELEEFDEFAAAIQSLTR
jgi:hypothetical protein